MLVARLLLTCVLGVTMGFVCPSPVAASSFTLSEFSNNATSPSVLEATLDFTVAGNVLTLVVQNTTQAGDLYDMNQVYFTTSDDVTDLTLLAASGSVDGSNLADWSLDDNVGFGGFGTFDFALIGPQQGGDGAQLTPNEIQTFTLSIACAALATCDLLDFASELSTLPLGSRPVFVAAKFVNGPADNSAGGGTANAPEPSAALLLLVIVGAAPLYRARA